MKDIIIGIVLAIPFIATHACNEKSASPRDYEYERYCDSLYIYDEDYYFDVLEETDEYQDYIKEHGAWWNQD
jgi:hypothetical protein